MPFAQLLLLLLVAFSVLIPLYVIVFTKSRVVGPILCFFLFESLWCLNEVAKELENPFGQDMNDISLPDFHLRFVDNLETVSQCEQRQMLDPGDDCGDFNPDDLRSLANQPPPMAVAVLGDTTKLRL